PGKEMLLVNSLLLERRPPTFAEVRQLASLRNAGTLTDAFFLITLLDLCEKFKDATGQEVMSPYGRQTLDLRRSLEFVDSRVPKEQLDEFKEEDAEESTEPEEIPQPALGELAAAQALNVEPSGEELYE